MEPHAAREFRNRDFAWLIHRQIYLRGIDVLQLEYTALGQYHGGFRRIPSILFEHDIYFQSIARRLPLHDQPLSKKCKLAGSICGLCDLSCGCCRSSIAFRCARRENARLSASFLPALKGKIDDDNRAGIDTSSYEFRVRRARAFHASVSRQLPASAESGSAELVPARMCSRKSAQPSRGFSLIVIGSDPPPRHSLPDDDAIELAGFVEDVREPLARYAVFICPILSGSGIRVKLLEAFRGGDTGGFDAHRRGGFGGRRRRDLRAGG